MKLDIESEKLVTLRLVAKTVREQIDVVRESRSDKAMERLFELSDELKAANDAVINDPAWWGSGCTSLRT